MHRLHVRSMQTVDQHLPNIGSASHFFWVGSPPPPSLLTGRRHNYLWTYCVKAGN